MKPIALVGFYGSGKTGIGRKLAKELRVPFADLAGEIENRSGMRTPELYQTMGESGYRALESLVLSGAAAQGGVLSTTGGCVMLARNRRVLHDSFLTVFLDAPFETTWAAIDTTANPSVESLTKSEMKMLYDMRYPLFCATAHITIDMASPDPTLIDEIIDKLFAAGIDLA